MNISEGRDFRRVSKSIRDRKANIEIALRLMMQDLAEPYEWQEIDSSAKTFSTVFRTTWEEMVERGYIVPTSFNRYQFTGFGWIEGLKATGQFENQQFREKAGRLSRALKAKIKGSRDWGYANRTELASETGLSEFFIYDAIDSHLLREMFNCTDAGWAEGDQGKNDIDIPPRFGLDLL